VARLFVAASSQDVLCGAPAWLKFTRNFSISAFVKLTTLNAFRGIISFTSGGFYLRIDNANKVNFLCSQTADVLHGATALTSGTWYHVGVTIDNSSPANVVIYLNGVSDATGTTTQTFASPTGSMFIGQDLATESMDGSIAEVAVWPGVLSVAEFAALAAGALPYQVRPANFQLGFYMPLHGVGASEPDWSGRAANGSLQNAPTFAPHPPVRIPFSEQWNGGVPPPGVQAPQLYAAEVRSGPPMRGAPFTARLPIIPASTAIPPAALPSPSFLISPEIKGGPPMRGAPWLQHLPIQTPLLGRPPGGLPPGAVQQSYAREITSGPALRGAPWANHLFQELQQMLQAPPPPLPVGQSIPAPEISHGPPMRGAPWVAVLPIPAPTFSPSTAPPIPPVPPAPRPGQLAPLLPRDPVQDPRLRRFTELNSQIINSLIGKGQLLQTTPTSWAIAAGAFVEARAPGAGDDSTKGAFPGAIWINTLTSAVYVNVSDAPASAVWVPVGSGPGGLTGHFP
jgi:hypothetical protein